MGRPGPKTKLTPEVQERLCTALRGGNFRKTACAWAGIPYRSFHEWMLKGERKKSGPLAEFRRAVIEAEKAAEIRAVALVLKAAEKDPRHAEWWLSHRFPERWADKARHEMRLAAKANAQPIIQVMSYRDQEPKGE